MKPVGRMGSNFSFIISVVLILPAVSCTKSSPQPPNEVHSRPSDIHVEVRGPVLLTTSVAEFQILPSGFLQATLLKDGKRLTLDEPNVGSTGGSDSIVHEGTELDFVPDFSQTKVVEATSKLGRGKCVEIPAKPLAASGIPIERTLVVEAYDNFPGIALVRSTYKNVGTTDFQLDEVLMQQHRFNSHAEDAKGAAHPYDMWAFEGSSYDWGKDDVFRLTRNFSQPNFMGEAVKGGFGGGIPVAAFWTASVGEAIGHVETVPWTLSIPVKVESDGRVSASIAIPVNAALPPGKSYSTPRSFVAVYAGDFYEPLRMWSRVLQKEGWELPRPSNEAYHVSWCGWGYQFNVTPKQMLGTIPKLKELGIRWATLDDRWFDTYGDWNPRSDTFPGNAIEEMVSEFHRQGIMAQLWWLPLGVEDGQGKWPSHKYVVAKIVKEHPEWLILDKNGKHARMTRDLAALCPAVPEVQSYYKQLTEKFIRDWGFDGSKLDNIYSVPACYNPTHHHTSPEDSVKAMGEVYKTIFEATRAIKPESVTQACPCGTPPSLAWLPFIDQAVTADPVGAVQVRRRIKMYKALLGPQAAVYGDHVELSAMTPLGNGHWSENGADFASTLGTGGVPGTKFVWPEAGAKFKPVALTSDKEQHWKKWIALYNEKMLSRGEFRNLYVYGYDIPEGYAIEKDGKMYYAFFTDPGKPFGGEVELRGLSPGTYQVVDYVDGRTLGSVTADGAKTPQMKAEFREPLLLEVIRK